MRPISFLILATCWAPLPRVAAQGPGARVRLTMVSASSRHLVGTLIAQDADSLWVQVPAHAAPVSVARSAVVLEVSRGRRRAIGQGAGIGAGLGLIGGLVLSSVAAGKSDPCATSFLQGLCAMDRFGFTLRGGLIGAAVGAALGGALGYAVRTERWEGVAFGRDHHLALAPRGAGLALSLTF